MSNSTSKLHKCCEALVGVLGASQVLLSGGPGYDAESASYFSPQQAAVQPGCYILPITAAEVSSSLISLTSADGCNFAVRSGGHQWFPGASNAQDGVTIDLRGLHTIDIAQDLSTVSIGPGATWDKVYAQLETVNRTVAGGRVAGVGVGGLTLGGGISYYGPRKGWACNQVNSFQVVVANGSIVTASATQNSDLWWGLRGGSNNLGIVTQFNLDIFEQGPIYLANTFNPISVVSQQAKIYAKLMSAATYDTYASFLTGWAFVGAEDISVAINQLGYTKPNGNSTPAYYQPVLALPSALPPSVVVANMSTLAAQSVSAQPPLVNRYLSTVTTIVPTEQMLLATYAAFNASLASVKNVTGLQWSLSIEAVPPHFYALGAKDNALGLADRKGTIGIAVLAPAWTDAAQDAQVYAASRALIADIEKRGKKIGGFDPYLYLNYAAPWQNPIASYGSASVRRLERLRASVDPHGIFSHQETGAFKIP